MAGIGVVLRKMVGEDNLSGFIRAYFHSSVIAVGPWILIVLGVSIIHMLSIQATGIIAFNEFLSVLIYNLCFSFILSGPIQMVTARYVSDCLYMRRLSPIPGIMTTSFFFLLLTTFPIVVPFYIFYASMNPLMTILSIANFFLLCLAWVSMIFLSLLRDYRAVTFSWVFSIILIILLGSYLGVLYKEEGIIFGINIGLSFLVASLTAHVMAEYHFPFHKPKNYQFYFTYYSMLCWSGLFFFASLWIDKVIMWAAPEAITHLNNLRTNPIYDGAMFYSYLSIIPVMGLFTISLETNFYDSYIQYVRCIENNAPYSSIERERKAIISKVIDDGRSCLVLQGAISLVVILFAPQIFDLVGIDYLQLTIFRLGTVGAFFSSMIFFIVVIFSYFDSQNNMEKVTGFTLVSNALLTFVSLFLGFPFYGAGFCLAMIISFLYSAVLFFNFLENLNYHIFITNTVKKQVIREKYVDRPTFSEERRF